MGIAVLDRVFSILEVLARSGRALSLAELAEESPVAETDGASYPAQFA